MSIKKPTIGVKSIASHIDNLFLLGKGQAVNCATVRPHPFFHNGNLDKPMNGGRGVMSMNKKTTTIFYIGTWLLFFVTEGCGIFCGIISDTNTRNILFILTVSLSAIVSLLFLFLEENHIATTLMLPVLTFFVCSAYFEDIAKKISFLLCRFYCLPCILLQISY